MLRGFGRGVALGAAVLAGEVAYARSWAAPAFDDLDPTGSFGDPGAVPLRLVVLGDSTVTGPGLNHPDETWARLSARCFSGRYRVELTSLAVGGSKSGDVLADQLPEALALRPHVAIVSVGSNDILRMVPVWRFERRLDEVIGSLVEASEAVILFGVGDLGTIPRLLFPLDKVASASGKVADRVHRRVAVRWQVAKVDQWRLTTVPFRSGLHMFSPDMFHPSAEGHRAWADALIPTLEEVVGDLERRGSIRPMGEGRAR